MRAIFHFFSHLSPWRARKSRERKQLERRVVAGTERAINEYRTTFEKLKEYDKRWRVQYLDVELMEKMCHRLAVAVFDTAEDPIAPFHKRTLSLLDSALQLPRATFDGAELYPSLDAKAATLFYALIRNHAFPNGNKRIAVAALLVFLFINERWINVGTHELYEQAIMLATSDPGQHQTVRDHFRAWLEVRMVKEL